MKEQAFKSQSDIVWYKFNQNQEGTQTDEGCRVRHRGIQGRAEAGPVVHVR